jgi:hypothetical protein
MLQGKGDGEVVAIGVTAGYAVIVNAPFGIVTTLAVAALGGGRLTAQP